MAGRIENILQAMIDGTSSEDLPEAQSRNEALLKQVLDKMDGGGALSQEVKTALLNLFRHTAYIDDQGADLITDLERAFSGVKPVRIGAVYNPPTGYVVYTDDNLDKVSAYLTVTLYYSDDSSAVVTDYTLTGTLTEGVSTLTVEYDDFTTTVQVTVANPLTAVYNPGSHEVYPTDALDSLRNYLTVTGRDGTQITNYSLTGNIGTVGTRTVTVISGSDTATVSVPVVENTSGLLYDWDFTKSLTDLRQNTTAILKTGEADEAPGKSEGTTPPVRGNTGVVFNNAQQVLRLFDSDVDFSALMFGKTIQIDVAEFNFVYNNSLPEEIRRAVFVATGDPTATVNKGLMLYTRCFMLDKNWNWVYWGQWRNGESWTEENALLSGKNAISGHTIGLHISDDGRMNVYVDGVYKGTSANVLPSTDLHGLQIGSGSRPNYGGAFYNARITGVRIYDGNAVQ